MPPPQADPRQVQGVRRRDLLKAGLMAGVTMSACQKLDFAGTVV